MKLILATKNLAKIQEITEVLKDLGIELVSMKDVGFEEEIVEGGQTLEENALLKARAVAEFTHEWAVADDAGLFIDALNGEPGINVERWSGPKPTGKELVDFTLEKLKDVPDAKRTARFETVVVLMHPNGSYRTFEGKVFGKILMQPKGEMHENQPYNILFQPLGYKKALSEFTPAEKVQVSHRGQAFQKVREFLKNEVLKGE